MKKYLAAALVAVIILLLCGCSTKDPNYTQQTTASTTLPSEPTEATAPLNMEETTVSPTTQATETTVPPTTEKPTKDVPYLKSLAADVPIYDAPGGSYKRDVGENGVYTIVEERYDTAGNLWGRLKSGVGWVMLTETPVPPVTTPSVAAPATVIKVSTANKEDLQKDHYAAVLDQSTSTIHALLKTDFTLTNFKIYSTRFDNSGLVREQELYSLESFTSEKPIIAHISLPGDFSAYIITFDYNGTSYVYHLGESGLDGSLYLSKQ